VADDRWTDVEARLAARRASTITQIDELTRSLDDIIGAATAIATDDEHDPEGQTIAFERAQLASLLKQARSRLADLEAAERRLADGTYGRCERCDRPIPPERLGVRPMATTCIACASKRSG
jgi:RNA polymerase-binding transcription factor DksA